MFCLATCEYVLVQLYYSISMLTDNASFFNCTTATQFVQSLRDRLNPKYYASYRPWDCILHIVADCDDEPVATFKVTSLKSHCFNDINTRDEDELSNIAFIYVKYFEETEHLKPEGYISLLPATQNLIWHSETSVDSFELDRVTPNSPPSYYLKDSSKWKTLEQLSNRLQQYF